jgi:hypothetical protein
MARVFGFRGDPINVGGAADDVINSRRLAQLIAAAHDRLWH